MKALCFVLLILTSPFHASFAGNIPPIEQTAQKVLDRLWDASGNYNFKKPRLKISNHQEVVAGYDAIANTILLEKKAYEICQKFGRDSSSALAYILGHELAHALHKESKNNKTSFLAYDKHYQAGIREEKTADIQGVLNAYLSGYKITSIVPNVIKEVYNAYNLNGKLLKGYPPLAERQQAAREVQQKVDQLIQIYETANYLVAIGQHELAAGAYSHILQYYQNREIYNNIGLNYALQAMNFTSLNVDSFLYPFEIDWSTRLRKPKMLKDKRELSYDEKMKRNMLLLLARKNLIEAAKFTDGYMTAEINLLCVYSLSSEYDIAIRYISDNQLLKRARQMKLPDKQFEHLRLAMAINYAQSDSPVYQERAKNIFKDLKEKASCEANSIQAVRNLEVLDGDLSNENTTHNCSLTLSQDKLQIKNPANFDYQVKLIESVDFQINQLTNTTLIKIWDRERQFGILLKRTPQKNNALRKSFGEAVLNSTSGAIYHCPEKKIIFHDKASPELVVYVLDQKE